MYSHELDRIVFFFVVILRLKGNLVYKFRQGHCLAVAFLIFHSDALELGKVVKTLHVPKLAYVCFIACLPAHITHRFSQRNRMITGPQPVYELHEILRSAVSENGIRYIFLQRLKKGAFFLKGSKTLHFCPSEPAAGLVYDSFERAVIVEYNKLKICHDILDFHALIEFYTAEYLIGYPLFCKFLFNDTGQKSRTVEHRKISVSAPGCPAQLSDIFRNPFGFLKIAFAVIVHN